MLNTLPPGFLDMLRSRGEPIIYNDIPLAIKAVGLTLVPPPDSVVDDDLVSEIGNPEAWKLADGDTIYHFVIARLDGRIVRDSLIGGWMASASDPEGRMHWLLDFMRPGILDSLSIGDVIRKFTPELMQDTN
jgi:hypothetical protein